MLRELSRMEEYLQYSKILRLQMNDGEDQALKNSVEEHMYFLTTQTVEISLLGKLETAKRASETEASADTVGGSSWPTIPLFSTICIMVFFKIVLLISSFAVQIENGWSSKAHEIYAVLCQSYATNSIFSSQYNKAYFDSYIGSWFHTKGAAPWTLYT